MKFAYTYQDLLEAEKKIDFVLDAIWAHKRSDGYMTAMVAAEYDAHRNPTIASYQKLLYTISGETIPDTFNANYKLSSNFFSRFVTQQNQYLLGNGLSLSDAGEKEKLGKDFDSKLQRLGRKALVEGVAFGFWNLNHMEAFGLTEFVPLWDEETSGLAAGIRFWQVSGTKPLRATLYELDGYTDYIWRDGKGEVRAPKRPYVFTVAETPIGDSEIVDGRNYPSFPIVPLWGNSARQSEIVGIREQIDCYDLIKSGFANDLDDASQIYWIINNAGGMDDIDLAKFVERMRTVKAAVVEDDGARAEQHVVEVPCASREALLSRLRADLYEDFMALDTKEISGGAVTATQIKAAYEPLNNKTDEFEYCVLEFLDGILPLAGVESVPGFTRSAMVNVSENVTTLLQAAQVLPQDYVVPKILEYLGDGDKAEEVMEQVREAEMMQLAAQAVQDEA